MSTIFSFIVYCTYFNIWKPETGLSLAGYYHTTLHPSRHIAASKHKVRLSHLYSLSYHLIFIQKFYLFFKTPIQNFRLKISSKKLQVSYHFEKAQPENLSTGRSKAWAKRVELQSWVRELDIKNLGAIPYNGTWNANFKYRLRASWIVARLHWILVKYGRSYELWRVAKFSGCKNVASRRAVYASWKALFRAKYWFLCEYLLWFGQLMAFHSSVVFKRHHQYCTL